MSVFGFVLMVQFPFVLTAVMASPFFRGHKQWVCAPSDTVCSGCHHTSFPIIPISLSGVIGDTEELQMITFGSFALAFLAYFTINTLITPISVNTLKQFTLTTVVCGCFYSCLFTFPLRRGCEQR